MDLRQLKHKLLHDKQLAPIYDYFLDHFSNTEFIARGPRSGTRPWRR